METGTRKSEDSPVVSARIRNSLFITGNRKGDNADLDQENRKQQEGMDQRTAGKDIYI